MKEKQKLKKLLNRVGLVGVLMSLIYIGRTGAFFHDSETSQSNVLVDGGIDLQIDDTSWYNGVLQPLQSWELKDLEDELFFNFLDLKPGDWEEDTISLHIINNDAWVCSEITLTESADNGITEPEAEVGDMTDGQWAGELDEELNFIFWPDDGDNVLEDDEQIIFSATPAELPQNPGAPVTLAIADSNGNIFNPGPSPSPLTGSQTYYIGKAFCFGALTATPLAQDGFGNVRTPGDPAGPGFTCYGALVDNQSQTDSVRGDISFFAIQSRDLPDFVCGQPIPTPIPTPSPTPTPTPSPIANHLVINEILYDTSTSQNISGQGGSNRGEWIEIYNPTASSVNVNGWIIEDNTSSETLANITIPAGGFLILTGGTESEFEAIWTVPASTQYAQASGGTIGNGFANDGDLVRLKDNLSNIIDQVSWGNDTSV